MERDRREREADRAGEHDERHDPRFEKNKMIDDAAPCYAGFVRSTSDPARNRSAPCRHHALIVFPPQLTTPESSRRSAH